MQISKYVEREILNHKRLNQPHIIELREVLDITCTPPKLQHGRAFLFSDLRSIHFTGLPDTRISGNCHGVRSRG